MLALLDPKEASRHRRRVMDAAASDSDNIGMFGLGNVFVLNERGRLKDVVDFCNKVTDTGDQYYGSRHWYVPASYTNSNFTTAVSVSSISTGSTTVTVTTSAAHYLVVGDIVTISGLTSGAANANGTWIVASTPSSTTFTILVQTAPTGTGTGTLLRPVMGGVSSMKLGTGSTAAAKNGAGAALVTYQTGSVKVVDANYPTFIETAGAGTAVLYQTTWPSGWNSGASWTGIQEAVIVIGEPNATLAGSYDATTTAAYSIARATFTSVNKNSTDTLVVQWTHTLLGS
jgi:hypothetical protein